MKHSPLEMAAKWLGMACKSVLMTLFYLLSAMRVFKKDDGDKK